MLSPILKADDDGHVETCVCRECLQRRDEAVGTMCAQVNAHHTAGPPKELKDVLESETKRDRLAFARAFYVQNRHARDARYENDVEYRSAQDCIDHAIEAFDKIEEACK